MIFEDLMIESLGTVVPRYPYVVNNQIYPVGFISHRNFTSRLNRHREVRYTSMIIDAGDRPQFVVIASDEPDHPVISSESPSACWRVILQHFMEIDDHNTDAPRKISVSGRLRFGLTHPEVNALIRDMPNAHKALEMFAPMSPSKRKYNSISDDSADESKLKAQKYGSYFAARNTPYARDEMDDLEGAIATLQALKYCSVF